METIIDAEGTKEVYRDAAGNITALALVNPSPAFILKQAAMKVNDPVPVTASQLAAALKSKGVLSQANIDAAVGV